LRGIAPDGKVSPAPPSTRFRSNQDWLETRQQALQAISAGHGKSNVPINLNYPPGKGGNPADLTQEIIIEHASRPGLGQGFYGSGNKQKIQNPLNPSGKPVTVWPNVNPITGNLNRTKTLIEWVPDPAKPNGGSWAVRQHIPWGRDFDFSTNTYTTPPNFVIP
jgi:hypothetical protein